MKLKLIDCSENLTLGSFLIDVDFMICNKKQEILLKLIKSKFKGILLQIIDFKVQISSVLTEN